MNAIVLNEPGRFSLTETTLSGQAPAKHAVIRIRRIGICGTDLHAFKGEQPFFTYPRVLGHELGVEILSVGANSEGLREWDLCAVEPYLHCGECIACRRGKTNCCERLQVLGVHVDGGMRELMAIPTDKLHRSGLLSLDQLALVEPLCVGAHAVERAQVEAGEFVVVVGAGPIGMAVMEFARVASTRVIAVDINAERLRFVREQFEIEAAIQAGDGSLDQIKAITGGDLPTLVFDATGSLSSMNNSFNLPAPGGRLVLVGFCAGDLSFNDQEAHRRELSISCSRNAKASDFKRVIELLEAGTIDIEPWITHRVAFGNELLEAFPAWIEPQSKFIKAIVEV